MAKWLNFAPPKIEQGKRYLQKTIEQRLENLDKYGKDWPNRPVSTYFFMQMTSITLSSVSVFLE